jgi:hypothetical protein
VNKVGRANHFLATAMVASIAVFPSTVLAEEFPPTSGTLIGSRDGDLLDFDCTPLGTDKISCDFVQVLLTNKSNDAKLSESLGTIPQLLEELQSESLCEVFEARKALLRGETVEDSKASEEAQKMIEGEQELSSKASPQMLEKMNKFYGAIDKLCLEKDENAARELLVLSHESSAEICEPFFNRYTQTFVRVDQNLWVVESSPLGSCGIVNTSRLYGDPKYPFLWNYEASKIITNKSGTDVVPCSGLDERPQTYAWDQPPVFKNCRFLE